MRRVDSRQLAFVFADSPKGGGQAKASDVSEAKAWLLLRANAKETSESAAGAGETDRLLDRPPADSCRCSPVRCQPEEPDVRSTSPVL